MPNIKANIPEPKRVKEVLEDDDLNIGGLISLISFVSNEGLLDLKLTIEKELAKRRNS